jgi:hypothetical protein
MQTWVEEELETADIGDERLNSRYCIILDQLSKKPSVSIPAACGGWSDTQSAYRFFNNARVNGDELLNPHRDATLKRIAEHPVVLVVQDTTEVEVTRAIEKMEGAGPLNDESRIGFFDHALLVLTPDKIPLGVVGVDIHARDWDEFRENQKDKKAKKQAQRTKPIEEKESYRWLEGLRVSNEIAEEVPETQIVAISDSESDVYEFFAAGQPARGERKAEWIVRACQDRSVVSQTEPGSSLKLWNEVSSTPVLGTMEIEVSKNIPKSSDPSKRNQARSARVATATIQSKRVIVRGPDRPGGRASNIEINAVLIRETHPPKGEKPVEWLLLTSLPIKTFAQVCLIISYYCCRWQIEIFFRILKSGCGIEKLQFENAERFKACLTLYMIISWRVLYTLMLGRECPELSVDKIFSEDEWKSVYAIVKKKPAPQKPPKLSEMIPMIASLGGYLGRASDGPPGPKTMWIGMQRMADMALAWRTFGPPKIPQETAKKCV